MIQIKQIFFSIISTLKSRDSFLIALATILPKVFLVIIPYLLTSESYNLFNQYYYAAGLLILFANLGFDIAYAVHKISKAAIILIIATNIFVFLLLLNAAAIISFSFLDSLIIFPYAFAMVLLGIYFFKLLFEGKVIKYFLMYFIIFVINISALLFSQIVELSPFTLLAIFYTLFFIIYSLTSERETQINESLITLYTTGVSAFIINGAFTLASSIDKITANNLFEPSLANAYTFSWVIVSPIFYLGVFLEKLFYSEERGSSVRRYFGITFVVVISYLTFVICALFFSHIWFPHHIDNELVNKIILPMLGIFGLFTLVHYPLNAFMYKNKLIASQRKIAFGYTVTIVFFALVYNFIEPLFLKYTYQLLLLFFGTFLFVLMGIRSAILYLDYRKLNESKN